MTPIRFLTKAREALARTAREPERAFIGDDAYRDNWVEVAKENGFLLKRMNFCTCFNMTVMAVISPFLSGFDGACALYIASALLTFAFGVFCQICLNKYLKLVKPLFYALLAGMCAYGVALSAFLYPDIHAVTLVGMFMLTPMIILDETRRVNGIVFGYYLVSCVFAALRKPPAIAVDDCVTCGAFVVFGMLIGSYLRAVRMRSIMQHHQLKYQRDMDDLTKLPNRRVLFETLEKADKDGENERVMGIFMADIDEFKAFNDLNGHQAGDEYLEQLGGLFENFALEQHISIFRYGGEEFLGLCPGKSQEEMKALSWKLVECVRRRNILSAGVTISVGYAHRKAGDDITSEKLISVADGCLYEAKKLGRDRAVGKE